MTFLHLYNSLTRRVEAIKPVNDKKFGVYCCGPTVYSYVTIGNWRTYFLSDMIVRSLKYLGYQVNYVMNITDVGHLTGDNLGDADIGEDRLEKAAAKEGRNAWQIAEFYTQDFLSGYQALNLTQPKVFCRATDHIAEQIKLVQDLLDKGMAYITSDGVYFDTQAYEQAGYRYGELSELDQIQHGARVQVNLEKKDPRDFALWKFSPPGQQRHMEWDSPWAPPGKKGPVKGFPGWHIECSAMSMKYLGQQFDIHVGGEDLRSIHHPNEIAQSQAACGVQPFVRYWIHGAFLLVEGQRMGKSLGNAYNLHDLEQRGYQAMSLRYFYLTGHYRKQLNFTWAGLSAAQKALNKLRQLYHQWQQAEQKPDQAQVKHWEQEFVNLLTDDLKLPQILALVWQLVADKQTNQATKYQLLDRWNQVLGLDLKLPATTVPEEIKQLADKRWQLKQSGQFDQADQIRKQILEAGWQIQDSPEGYQLKPID